MSKVWLLMEEEFNTEFPCVCIGAFTSREEAIAQLDRLAEEAEKFEIEEGTIGWFLDSADLNSLLTVEGSIDRLSMKFDRLEEENEE